MIQEGSYVIAKVDTLLRLVQVRRDRPLFLGKRKFHIGSTIGHPFGSFFDIKRDGTLTFREKQPQTEISLPKVADSDEKSVDASDGAQKLTTNDIEGFKAEGIPGEEIVKLIVENSASFKEKSVYSQEKYLKKKQHKYVEIMQILQPNTRNLVETFYNYSPQKVCNLRVDTLAQMVTFCNIISGGKYIVVDSVLGMLTAAVLERIGDDGLIVQLCMASSPLTTFRHAVDALNIPSDKLQSVLHTANFHKVMGVLHGQTENLSTASSYDASVDENCMDSTDTTEQSSTENSKQSKLLEVRDILLQKDMDGLLVAIKHHPYCICALLDFLAYSRPFAIFSMYLEPLVDCYSLLKSRRDVILLNISDTWLRKYQVLSERTHPEYQMSGNGGFLLTGVRVERKT